MTSSSDDPRFRPRALEASRQHGLAELRLVRPVLGKYTRKAHVRGRLVPEHGWIRLVSPQIATVAERRVVQSQSVCARDPAMQHCKRRAVLKALRMGLIG